MDGLNTSIESRGSLGASDEDERGEDDFVACCCLSSGSI